MELKPIDHTDRARGRLNAAFGIYRETILPEAQNPERQILYWIEHSREKMTDQFRCFALQRGTEVVGYLQYSYFCQEELFFFEYLCLKPSATRGLAPTDAVAGIRDYLAEHYPENFKVVFEVARRRCPGGKWEADRKLINYFRRIGFRTVDFDYRYPILQSYDGATSYPADLMVNLPKGRKRLSSSEMRTILRCLYFKHYLNWDRPFLDADRFRERERLIDDLYNAQISQIQDKDSFDTKGDDKRSLTSNLLRKAPALGPLATQVFGPKLPRLVVVGALILWLERVLGSVWLLIPFTIVSAAAYCLAEDTEASRKLFAAIIKRMGVVRPQ